MELDEILGFEFSTEHDLAVFTQFTTANKEYFRRQFLRAQFMVGQVEPNYDYPHQHMVEIARRQAAADVYMSLMELCETRENEAKEQAERATEESQPSLATFMSNSSAI